MDFGVIRSVPKSPFPGFKCSGRVSEMFGGQARHLLGQLCALSSFVGLTQPLRQCGVEAVIISGRLVQIFEEFEGRTTLWIEGAQSSVGIFCTRKILKSVPEKLSYMFKQDNRTSFFGSLA